MPPRRLLVPLLCAVLAAGVPAACGGDDDDGGKRVSGTGYELVVPDGWRDQSDDAGDLGFAGFEPDVVLVGERDRGFRPSVNVVLEASLSPSVTLDDYVEAGRRVLARGAVGDERIPGEGVELGEVRRASLGGEPAAAFDHSRRVGERPLRARQVVAVRQGSAYTVTYTALEERFEKDLPRLEQVLASWRWR